MRSLAHIEAEYWISGIPNHSPRKCWSLPLTYPVYLNPSVHISNAQPSKATPAIPKLLITTRPESLVPVLDEAVVPEPDAVEGLVWLAESLKFAVAVEVEDNAKANSWSHAAQTASKSRTSSTVVTALASLTLKTPTSGH